MRVGLRARVGSWPPSSVAVNAVRANPFNAAVVVVLYDATSEVAAVFTESDARFGARSVVV